MFNKNNKKCRFFTNMLYTWDMRNEKNNNPSGRTVKWSSLKMETRNNTTDPGSALRNLLIKIINNYLTLRYFDIAHMYLIRITAHIFFNEVHLKILRAIELFGWSLSLNYFKIRLLPNLTKNHEFCLLTPLRSSRRRRFSPLHFRS